MNTKNRTLEVMMWSIAFPGFGQLLNKKYVKGILFIFMEVVFNILGHFNQIIISSFHGETVKAFEETNYLWLMFYPCLYFFALWDAYKDAGGGKKPYSYMPFVFSAYFVTLGLILSPHFTFFGIFFGPLWLPTLFWPIGLFVGMAAKYIITTFDAKQEKT